MRFYHKQQVPLWDDFICSAGPLETEFLQSMSWGEIMAAKGIEPSYLYEVDKEGDWQMASALYKQPLVFSYYYWYCPRGPFLKIKAKQEVNKQGHNPWQSIFKAWQKEALGASLVFIRFEPSSSSSVKEIKQAAQSLDLSLKRVAPVQAPKSCLLDLSLGEEEIKKQMKPKTRYNLALSQKKGLTISFSPHKFNDFWQLLEKTAQRDVFRLHSREHYQKLLETGQKNIKLISILDGEKVIAAGLFSFFGQKAVYLHGASDYQERAKMAPYLLQWTAIKRAIDLSYRYYDFHGIDEKKWPGLTRFKQGFGGFTLQYPGSFDLIIFPKIYFFYNFLKKKYRFLKKIKNYVSRN